MQPPESHSHRSFPRPHTDCTEKLSSPTLAHISQQDADGEPQEGQTEAGNSDRGLDEMNPAPSSLWESPCEPPQKRGGEIGGVKLRHALLPAPHLQKPVACFQSPILYCSPARQDVFHIDGRGAPYGHIAGCDAEAQAFWTCGGGIKEMESH